MKAEVGRWKDRSITPLARPVSRDMAADRLREYFERNGYCRVPALKRRKEGRGYKKGYEVRLVALTRAELGEMRRLLRQFSFVPANPYRKHAQLIQSVHGLPAVKWFCPKLVAKKGTAPKRLPKTREQLTADSLQLTASRNDER
jgi:hypothetical protein